VDVVEIEGRRTVVAQELAAVAGDASLCTLSASGGPVDGVKYLEGRLAVLTELRRALRAGAEPAEEVVGRLARQWRGHLDRARADSLARGWIAYRAGGVDELASLQERT
jgi:hypothetical protein